MKLYSLAVVFLSIFAFCEGQSPDQLYDELFDAVQSVPVFSDSKTFCDALPRRMTPNDILDRYRSEQITPNFNLTAFVFEHFILPNTTTIIHDKWTIEEHCHRLWPLLTRSTPVQEGYTSFITVPRPFVVPGGRFREFYYWDTYFTMLGLLRSKETTLVTDMLDNFAALLDRQGLIPNGNREYYKYRSQPPFFSLMTELVNQSNKYINALEKEYRFWMTKRIIQLDDGTVLNRYYDDADARPRPEAYHEDTKTANQAGTTDVYTHLRAAAESGWDFSSRWMTDEKNLSTIIAADILPVDLNCLLYHLETVLGKTVEAERRREAIRKYMWSIDDQFFTDYNYKQKKQTRRLTLAGLFPVWLDVSTATQAQAVARRIQVSFLRDGGVVTTLSEQSTQQWDSPNGWAPLQFVAYRALLKTPGYESVAKDIRQRWMSLNERTFKSTGKMMEKYDVVNMDKPAGGGEYETQDGFGWTNGVYLEMLYDRRADSGANKHQAPLFFIPLLLLSFLCMY